MACGPTPSPLDAITPGSLRPPTQRLAGPSGPRMHHGGGHRHARCGVGRLESTACGMDAADRHIPIHSSGVVRGAPRSTARQAARACRTCYSGLVHASARATTGNEARVQPRTEPPYTPGQPCDVCACIDQAGHPPAGPPMHGWAATMATAQLLEARVVLQQDTWPPIDSTTSGAGLDPSSRLDRDQPCIAGRAHHAWLSRGRHPP